MSSSQSLESAYLLLDVVVRAQTPRHVCMCLALDAYRGFAVRVQDEVVSHVESASLYNGAVSLLRSAEEVVDSRLP